MKKSLNFEQFGVSADYEVTGQEIDMSGMTLSCRPKDIEEKCPECGNQNIMKKGKRIRKLMTVPLGMKACWLDVTIAKRMCKDCGCRYEIQPGFAPKYSRATHVLIEYVQNLAQVMCISDVAALTGLGWDLVKDMVKERLEREYAKSDLKSLEYLSMDEIYSGKKKVLHTCD